MNTNLIVGKNLKILKEASGFTQDQIASFLGINRSAYANYEAGLREIPFVELEKLSNLFGCDMNLFFEEKNIDLEGVLACAFRFDNLFQSDMIEISNFKDVVKSYLGMHKISSL